MFRLAVDLRPLLERHESGVTHYAKALVHEFLQRGDLVELDLFYQARTRCEALHHLFPQVRHIPLSNTRFHLRCLLGFPTLPEAYFPHKPDLIWIPDRRPFYRTTIPLVMTVHDKVPELYPSTLSWKSRLWHLIFPLRRLLRLCSGLLVPTFTISQALQTKLPKEVTYEGAELEKATEPTFLSKKFPKRFYLMISPSDPRKRLDWVLRLAERFPKENFVIIGLKKQDKRFASIRLRKRSNLFPFSQITEGEKAWFLRRAKALLALSRYEGFDLPVLEAVAAKCPVIMSDISVHNELYKNALMVRSFQELEQAVQRLRTFNAPVPQPRGRYTWEAAAQRSLLFFLRILFYKNRKSGCHGNRHDHSHNTECFQTGHHG